MPTQLKGRERRLGADEEKKLLESAADYEGEISNIIQFAIESGMRRGEISELRWTDVDLRKCTASLWNTNNGDNRTIPLSPGAMQVLESMPRNINGRVFSMRPDSFTQAFDRVCKRAGIEDLRFHDLRHEATTRFFELGLSIMEVPSITGPKDLAMLRRYIHL